MLALLLLLALGGVEPDLEPARVLAREGRYPQAIAYLQRFPSSGWAWLLQADYAQSHEAAERARREAHRLFARDSGGRRAVELRWLRRAMRQRESGVAERLAAFRPEGLPPPQRSLLYRIRAEQCRREGDVAGARQNLEQALKEALGPDDRWNCWFDRYLLDWTQKRLEEAESDLREAARVWEGRVPAIPAGQLLQARIQLAIRGERWNEAETLLRLRLGADDDFSVWMTLCNVADRQGDAPRAQACWEKARALPLPVELGERQSRLLILLGPLPAKVPREGVEKELEALRERLPPTGRLELDRRLRQLSGLSVAFMERLRVRTTAAAAGYQRQGNFDAELPLRVWLGSQCRRRGAFQEGATELRRAFELRLALPGGGSEHIEWSLRSDAIVSLLGGCLAELGRHEEAFRACQRIFGTPLAVGQKAQILRSAFYHAGGCGPESQRWCFQQAEALLPQLAGADRIRLLEDMVRDAPDSALLAQLRPYYQERLEEARRSGPPSQLVEALRGQARLLERLGDPAGQLQALEEALELTRKHSLAHEEQWVQGLILESMRRGRPPADRLALSQRLKSGPLRADALQEGALALLELQRPEEAAHWLQELREHYLKAGSQHEADRLLAQLSRAWSQAGQLDKAYDALELRSRSLAAEPSRQGYVLAQMGQLRLSQGRPEEGEKLLRQGWEQAMAGDQARDVLWTYSLWSASARRPADLFERTRARLRTLQGDDLFAQLLAIEAGVLLREGRAADAVALLEGNPVPGLAEALRARDLDKRPELANWASPSRPATAPLALGALLDQLRLARPELGNLLTLRSTNLDGLQRQLAPHQLMVSYFAVGEALYVVGLTREGTHHRKIEVRAARLRELIREHLGEVSRPGSRLTREADLRQLLVASWEPWLGQRTQVLAVPTGDLWRVPLGQLVGERASVCLLSSGDLLRLADGRFERYTRGQALALGAPPDLPAALDELRAVPAAVLKTGAQARAAELTARPWQLIHIATHARFDSERPLQSYLELGREKLTLAGIHELKLPEGCLVVLSCCESGLGQDRAGSEPVSLATSFSAAGARTVISGLWQVDDEATGLLFRTFYAELEKGQSPLAALGAAQQVTRARYPHPYYWAGFSLLGCPD